MFAFLHSLPRLYVALKFAQAAGEPSVFIWVNLAASISACAMGGVLLVLSLTAMLHVEGTQVIIDELGITVESLAVPRRLARWLGTGRLSWKEIRTSRSTGCSSCSGRRRGSGLRRRGSIRSSGSCSWTSSSALSS